MSLKRVSYSQLTGNKGGNPVPNFNVGGEGDIKHFWVENWFCHLEKWNEALNINVALGPQESKPMIDHCKSFNLYGFRVSLPPPSLLH